MPKVLVALFRDLNYSEGRGWSTLDVKKYFLAVGVAKLWNYREKQRNFKAEERTNPLWGKNINKKPKQMHRIKVFFKLMI